MVGASCFAQNGVELKPKPMDKVYCELSDVAGDNVRTIGLIQTAKQGTAGLEFEMTVECFQTKEAEELYDSCESRPATPSAAHELYRRYLGRSFSAVLNSKLQSQDVQSKQDWAEEVRNDLDQTMLGLLAQTKKDVAAAEKIADDFEREQDPTKKAELQKASFPIAKKLKLLQADIIAVRDGRKKFDEFEKTLTPTSLATNFLDFRYILLPRDGKPRKVGDSWEYKIVNPVEGLGDLESTYQIKFEAIEESADKSQLARLTYSGRFVTKKASHGAPEVKDGKFEGTALFDIRRGLFLSQEETTSSQALSLSISARSRSLTHDQWLKEKASRSKSKPESEK